MNRVKIEYGKALVMTACALTVLALCVVGRTFEGAGGAIAFGAFTVYFVLKARAFARIGAGRGCGQTPRT